VMCTLIMSTGMQGQRVNKRHELYLKERQGLGIISSVIQNDQMSVT